MRSYDSTTGTYLGSRGGVIARSLVWVEAKNRTSGATETMGLWTGDDHQEFVIGGQTRLYFGAGNLLQLEPITMQTGLVVRMHKVTLSPLSPEVALLLRGYEPRLAPVEIHRALFWPESRDLIAAPHRVFRGWIDEVTIPTPEIGGAAQAEVTLASAARALTIPLALKKSDETQRLRGDDRFRRYADVSGAVDVWWGEARG